MTRWQAGGMAFVLVALLSGCETSSNSGTSTPVTATSGKELSAETVVAPLLKVDAAGLDEAVAKHPGKVVLIDFWATWCGPCRKAFPHTVALSRKYGDKPFAVMTVTLDSPDEEADAVQFLQENGAYFQNMISSYPDDVAAFEGFELKGIPHLRLYDRTGKLAATWDGFDEEEVEEKIKELLGQE